MNKVNETNCLSKALYKSKLLETKWTQYSGLIYIYGINFDCLLVKCTVCLRGLVNIYLTRLRKSGIASWTYCTTRVQKYNIQNLYMYVYFIYFIDLEENTWTILSIISIKDPDIDWAPDQNWIADPDRAPDQNWISDSDWDIDPTFEVRS